MTRPLQRHAPDGEQHARQIASLRERLAELEHALASMREQVAAHRATLTELQDRAERAEADRAEALEECCRQREIADVARRARLQLLDLLAVLDKDEDA